MNLHRYKLIFLAAAGFFFAACGLAGLSAPDVFLIEVLDRQTGRGVPMVELRTTSQIRLYTDSNGLAAFYEPGLMNQKVFFYVESPGYQFAADGFGIRGTVLEIQPGQTATLIMDRRNIAQRLYRVTGQGIYRDSVIAGRKVPIQEPLLNAQVCGQDSINNCIYQNKLFWFWGDTSRIGYALGHFATAGATSDIRLDADGGINLNYFVDQTGFSKKMFPLPDPGMIWIDGVITAVNDKGQEKMLCHFARHKDLGSVHEWGIGVYNDSTQSFEPVLRNPQALMPYQGCGHAEPVMVNQTKYWYFTVPFPPAVRMRVKAVWDDAIDPNHYEVFTKLGQKQGGAYRWILFGKLMENFSSRQQAQEALTSEWKSFCLYDIENGKAIRPHNGSVFWNNWRKKWIMIFNQIGGETSNLGEVWYAEADTPLGPWAFARKIVTHNRYSFYNPKQHPYFDKDGGRVIYFEGTYSYTFSGDEKQATPYYDYNQMMYRLDLDDPRFCFPEALYECTDKKRLTADEIRRQNRAADIEKVVYNHSSKNKNVRAEELKNPVGEILADWQARPGRADVHTKMN